MAQKVGHSEVHPENQNQKYSTSLKTKSIPPTVVILGKVPPASMKNRLDFCRKNVVVNH